MTEDRLVSRRQAISRRETSPSRITNGVAYAGRVALTPSPQRRSRAGRRHDDGPIPSEEIARLQHERWHGLWVSMMLAGVFLLLEIV